MKKYLLLAFSLLTTSVFAMDADTIEIRKKGPFYFSGGGNGAILSFASVKKNGENVRTIPRFTLFFNIGSNVNYDVSRHFGVFSGINLTNIGMITRTDSLKLKQRVYTVGVPLGIKIGNLDDFFVFTGVEANFPINYKEKRFIDGDKKGKFNEWFSDRSQRFMPAVFLGFQAPRGFNLKLQYYLGEFLNPDFTKGGESPYAGTESKLFFLTLGYRFARK